MAAKLQPAVTIFCLLRAGCVGGLTKKAFDADVAPAFSHQLSASELRTAYEAARKNLAAVGLVTRLPRKRLALGLTPKGSQRAASVIDIARWPSDATWAKAVRPRVEALFLGGRARHLKELSSADGLRRAILKFKYGKTPTAKRLSVEMQDRAAAAVGARLRDIRAVRKAVLQRVAEQLSSHPPKWLIDTTEPTPPSISLSEFSTVVRQMASETTTGRIGPFLVFISHVYDTLQQRHPEWGMSITEFKERLKEAALAGLVPLAVANVMEPEWMPDLRRSRIDDGVRRWDVVKLVA